ncbi:MAG: hypothetical protein E6J61_22950, partial [Deltaproteobacteria bacterium]
METTTVVVKCCPRVMVPGAEREVTTSCAGATTRVLAVTGTADRLPPVFASVPDAPTEKVIVPAAEPFSVSDQVNVALWAAARSTPAMHAVCAVGTEAGLAWLVCDTTGTVPTWTEAPPLKAIVGGPAVTQRAVAWPAFTTV